jgi:SAM-dependent methyltransferase
MSGRRPGYRGSRVGALRALALLACLAAGAPLSLQAQQQPARPNLDVPYVPTNLPTVEAMLRIANVGPDDFVIDLGSGDGRMLITAARLRGARGFGVDLDPERVKESIENARIAGVAGRVSFLQQNLFATDLSRATVITLYLLPRVNIELRPKLLRLAPGTRVVSHDFDMGDWQADIRATVRGAGSEVYFWVIPADVAGRWRVQAPGLRGVQAFDIEFKQKYQDLEAAASGLDRPVTVRDARLDGARIQFTVVEGGDIAERVRFAGRVDGAVMEGIARGDGTAQRGEQKWRAARAEP